MATVTKEKEPIALSSLALDFCASLLLTFFVQMVDIVIQVLQQQASFPQEFSITERFLIYIICSALVIALFQLIAGRAGVDTVHRTRILQGICCFVSFVLIIVNGALIFRWFFIKEIQSTLY